MLGRVLLRELCVLERLPNFKGKNVGSVHVQIGFPQSKNTYARLFAGLFLQG